MEERGPTRGAGYTRKPGLHLLDQSFLPDVLQLDLRTTQTELTLLRALDRLQPFHKPFYRHKLLQELQERIPESNYRLCLHVKEHHLLKTPLFLLPCPPPIRNTHFEPSELVSHLDTQYLQDQAILLSIGEASSWAR